jgi:lipopolysaccharide export system permease protein
MIFQRVLLREFATTGLATLFVLLGITLTTQLVRLLGQAASGAVTSEGVLALLGFTLLGYLAVLLSLTLFITVLLTLTRSYRDSEMVVWFSSGMGLTQWIRPVFVFAVPLVFTIGLLSFVLSPWAVCKSEEFRRMMDSRDDVAMVSPGIFQESRQADRVFFVEEVSGARNLVANVFVSSTQHTKMGVMVASRGYQETMPNGDRFLVLLDGRRYEGEAGTAEYKIYEFERYGMRIEASDGAVRAPNNRTTPTAELLRTPTPVNLAELSWRIGLPLSALILSLLAIPLSFVNRRGGRSMNLALARGLHHLQQPAVHRAGSIAVACGFVTASWGVHATMFALLVVLFYRRLTVFSLFRFFR